MSNGGHEYGNADLPCELGSGTEGPSESYQHVNGGGMIGMHFYKSQVSQKISHFIQLFNYFEYITIDMFLKFGLLCCKIGHHII